MSAITEYRVGTLHYDRRGLARLLFWLLLGDFAMNIMAMALPKLLPLHLNSLGIKADRIGWVLSLGPLASLLLSPFIGVWSDRLRTRWGRRRPFLLISTPILALGLMAIPFVRNYTLLCLLIMLVQVCNVLETVLFYLYADVIPAALMGRFMAIFNIVGKLGGLTFQCFLFPHFDTAPFLIWAVCGGVYLLFYQASMFAVKEGDYPPPVKEDGRKVLRDYVKDGFCSRYIWLLWGTLGMSALAAPAAMFVDLFSKNSLHLDLAAIGKMNALAMIPTMVLAYPAGWLVDRLGPRIVWSASCFLCGITALCGYLWVHDSSSMQMYYMANSCVTSFFSVSLMPMLYAHLPKNKFGQLVSTQSMVVQTLIFSSANIAGQLIAAGGNDYRIAFAYSAPFFIATPIFTWLLSRARNPFTGMEMAFISRRQLQKNSVDTPAQADGEKCTISL